MPYQDKSALKLFKVPQLELSLLSGRITPSSLPQPNTSTKPADATTDDNGIVNGVDTNEIVTFTSDPLLRLPLRDALCPPQRAVCMYHYPTWRQDAAPPADAYALATQRARQAVGFACVANGLEPRTTRVIMPSMCSDVPSADAARAHTAPPDVSSLLLPPPANAQYQCHELECVDSGAEVAPALFMSVRPRCWGVGLRRVFNKSHNVPRASLTAERNTQGLRARDDFIALTATAADRKKTVAAALAPHSNETVDAILLYTVASKHAAAVTELALRHEAADSARSISYSSATTVPPEARVDVDAVSSALVTGRDLVLVGPSAWVGLLLGWRDVGESATAGALMRATFAGSGTGDSRVAPECWVEWGASAIPRGNSYRNIKRADNAAQAINGSENNRSAAADERASSISSSNASAISSASAGEGVAGQDECTATGDCGSDCGWGCIDFAVSAGAKRSPLLWPRWPTAHSRLPPQSVTTTANGSVVIKAGRWSNPANTKYCGSPEDPLVARSLFAALWLRGLRASVAAAAVAKAAGGKGAEADQEEEEAE